MAKREVTSEKLMGNKNAEKWTLELSHNIFDLAIETANETDSYTKDERTITYYKYDFIGEVARNLGYYKSLFTELKDKFPELKHKHKQLIETLEANCFCNSKRGNIREATAIVNLKSNHGWTDRNEIDHTTKGEQIKFNIGFTTEDDKS
jgi:hypothetical protein